MDADLDCGEEEEGWGSAHDNPDAASSSYCCKEDLVHQTAQCQHSEDWAYQYMNSDDKVEPLSQMHLRDTI